MIIRKSSYHKKSINHSIDKNKNVIIASGLIPHLLQFAKSEFQKDDIIELHVHLTMNEVFYISKGQLILNIENKEFTLFTGDTFIIKKVKSHSLKFLSETELLYFNLEDYN